jgi:hypothetical protein
MHIAKIKLPSRFILGFLAILAFVSPPTSQAGVDFYCLVDRLRWALGHAKVQVNLRRSKQDLIIEKEVAHLQSLPEKYGRNGAEYAIPAELLCMPKVLLLRPEIDLGPATKLLPAVDYVKAIDPQSRVITVDDDIGYPNGMVNDLIYFSARLPEAAVGASSAKVSFWGIPAFFDKQSPILRLNKDERVIPADVLEGFGAVSYPAGKVDTTLVKKWALSCKECLLSDDLTVSMSLQKNGTPRYGVRSNYYNRGSLVQFTYGFGKDALHKGAGLKNNNSGSLNNVNQHKYQITFDAIKNHGRRGAVVKSELFSLKKISRRFKNLIKHWLR